MTGEHQPHVVGHVATGRDPLVAVGRDHPGQLLVAALVEPCDRGQRNTDEQALEHALPPGLVVEMATAVGAECGGHETYVVGAQGVGDERQRQIADVQHRQRAKHRALLVGVTITVEVARLLDEPRPVVRKGLAEGTDQYLAHGVVESRAVDAVVVGGHERSASHDARRRRVQHADADRVVADLAGHVQQTSPCRRVQRRLECVR